MSAGKRALTYDMFDAWWSIQGTTLSRDGEWLAYALTSQGLDGQLVVRNLRTGQRIQASARNEPDLYSRWQVRALHDRADEGGREKSRKKSRRTATSAGEGGQGRGEGQGQNRNQRNQPRNSAGIMALPAGTVTTVERVGNISLPEESSTWVALYKGNRAGAGGGGGAGRTWRTRRWRCGAGGRRREAQAQGRGDTERGAKRKDAGLRPDPPQPHDRSGHHDSARQRLRLDA